LAGRVVHLVDIHVGVVAGQVAAAHQLHTEQPLRAFEGRGDHGRQREVGLEHRVVQRVVGLAHLLGPVAPVPGLQRVLRAGIGHGLSQQAAFALQRRQGAGPHLVEQGPHPVGGASHGVAQLELGVVGVAHQRRLALTQRQDLQRHRPVVVRAGVAATADPGAPGLLAQVAPLREAEEGQDQRPAQGDHRRGQTAVGRRLARGGAHELGQAGHRRLVGQGQGEGVLVVAHRNFKRSVESPESPNQPWVGGRCLPGWLGTGAWAVALSGFGPP